VEIERALAWATERLATGPLLIAASQSPDAVAALQARHGRDVVGHAIEQAMATLAKRLVDAGVRRLIVAGGETSGAVVDRLKLAAFEIGPEIAPGVPVLGVSVEGEAMQCVLKSGNFGGEEFFAEAFLMMTKGVR
jgi:uncharacterized protein YgbK (DUF1537 family)